MVDDEGLAGLLEEEPVEKPRRGRPRGSRNTGASEGGTRTSRRAPQGLQEDLKQAHLGLSMVAIGATNPTILSSREVVDILEEQAGKWAAQAIAVARQDQRVMASLVWAMQSGVWIAFAAATASSVVTVAACTGKVAVPYGAVMYLQPKLAALYPPSPVPATAAAANGAGEPE